MNKETKEEFIQWVVDVACDGSDASAVKQFKQRAKRRLDLLFKAERERCAKDRRQLLKWMTMLVRRINKYDELKMLRGYPLTAFMQKYLPKEAIRNDTI